MTIRKGKFIFDDAAKAAYLERLAEDGLKIRAAIAIGTTIAVVRKLRKTDEEFDDLCKDAELCYKEGIERAIYERAIIGVEEPVFYQGVDTGFTVRKYSDSLLQFLAKAKLPQYGDKLKVDTHVTGGVLLTAAPAMNTAQWLESITPQQLPAADTDSDAIEGEIVDVEATAVPVK